MILVDDLGWNDLGCYGSSFHETPCLDAFAKTAVRFEQAYAAGSVCSPTRAALMTGLYPPRVRITDWIAGRGDRNQELRTPEIALQLPLESETVAEVFQEAGYRTFFAGKWHLGGEGFLPQQQGFDLNLGGHHLGSPPGGYFSPYKNPQLKDGPVGEYLPDRLTTESIEFLRTSRDEPFMLFLSYYTVHTPIQACERYLEHFQQKRQGLLETGPDEYSPEHAGFTRDRQSNAAYASMVAAMDENVGRLLGALDELGLSQNTLVVFTSDNGGLSTLPRKSAPTSVRPLRAGKGWLYEGGIRVPLLIRHPAASQALGGGGRALAEPVISMDVVATLCEATGLPNPGGRSDGESLSLLLRSESATLNRDALYWHYPHYHGSAWKPGAAVRNGDWKLIEFYESGATELYNLDEDPSESHDVADQNPDVVARLKQKLAKWQQSVGGELPVAK